MRLISSIILAIFIAASAYSQEADASRPGGMLKLVTRTDRLTLTDGTKVEGSIVAVGNKAVIIITPEGEKTIAREKIERIERNQLPTRPPRTFETEILDGRERVVVTPGTDDEPKPEETQPGPKAIPLQYNPKKGQTWETEIDVTRRDLEMFPGKAKKSTEEHAKILAKANITNAGPADWTADVTFVLKGMLRDFVDVTPLEAKAFTGAKITRVVSNAGVWQPSVDKGEGAPTRDPRFARWLNLTMTPLPAKALPHGEAAKAEAIIPAIVLHQMLPLPEQAEMPLWNVEGTYVVKGTADVGGYECAIITIALKGAATGTGKYAGSTVDLEVKSSGVWEIYFALELGRPLMISVKTVCETNGKILNEPFSNIIELEGTATALVTQPVKPDAKAPTAEPQKQGEELERALDDLLKQINKPQEE